MLEAVSQCEATPGVSTTIILSELGNTKHCKLLPGNRAGGTGANIEDGLVHPQCLQLYIPSQDSQIGSTHVLEKTKYRFYYVNCP